MSIGHERAQVLVHLDAIERALKTLLAALQSKHAPKASIENAMATLESLPFDAGATARAFQDASTEEKLLVNKRLTYLADLDAVARTECQRLLATTTLAIERAQVLRTQLDTLPTKDETGDSIDCVR